jgi:uncharacterized protein (DUF433 family)
MTMVETSVQVIEYVVKTPGICGGAARIGGRRIPVYHIVYAYYHQEVSVEHLARNHDLTPAQIYAALAYYHDHLDEINQLIADDELAEASISPENAAMRETLRQRWLDRHGKDPDREMTVSEIAAEYGISAQAIRKACARGVIPARKSGAIWLVRRLVAEARWGGNARHIRSR